MNIIRKHKGVNKFTGKLKKGYKYSGKKLKSGLPQIIKIQSASISRQKLRVTLRPKKIRSGAPIVINKDLINLIKSFNFNENNRLEEVYNFLTDTENINLIQKKLNEFVPGIDAESYIKYIKTIKNKRIKIKKTVLNFVINIRQKYKNYINTYSFIPTIENYRKRVESFNLFKKNKISFYEKNISYNILHKTIQKHNADFYEKVFYANRNNNDILKEINILVLESRRKYHITLFQNTSPDEQKEINKEGKLMKIYLKNNLIIK